MSCYKYIQEFKEKYEYSEQRDGRYEKWNLKQKKISEIKYAVEEPAHRLLDVKT